MKLTPMFKTTLLSVSLLSLAACAGDSDDSDTNPVPTNDGVVTGENPGDGEASGDAGASADGGAPADGGSSGDGGAQADGGAAGEDQGAGTAAGGDNAGLNDATPRIATLACGELPIADIATSVSATAPAAMTTDMIVSGRIDGESAGNTEHYWTVDLQPGYYHMVLDTATLSGRSTNIGLEFSALSGPEAEDDATLLRLNEIGFRVRDRVFLEIEQARTMTIRVTGRFGAEDYTFALFTNGSAVPSPYFDDCPTIEPLALGTTEALTVPAFADDNDSRWYQVDLEAEDYVLNSAAMRTDGRDSNIVYRFSYVDQFGETSRYETISRPNEIGASHTESGALRPSKAGLVWIRLTSGAELNMEFTLQPDD